MSRFSSARLAWGANREEAVARFASNKSGAVIYRHKTLPLAAVIVPGPHCVYAVWCGKGARPVCYYAAASFASALFHAERKWKACAAGLESKASRRAEICAKRASLKASDHFSVGDVIVNTWGYEQTNVDFYQVTHVGARSVKVRRIADKRAENSFMAGLCQPDRFNFTGPEILKTLSADGSLRFEFGGASKWDGKARRWSAYA